MTASTDISIEKQNCIKEAYAENVATIIQAVGFVAPVKFFNQAHSIIGIMKSDFSD